MYFYNLSCGAEDGHTEITLYSVAKYSQAGFEEQVAEAVKEVVEKMMPKEIEWKKEFLKMSRKDHPIYEETINKRKNETPFYASHMFRDLVILLCEKYGFYKLEYQAKKEFYDYDEVATIPAIE
jgi:hypothetical protein